MYRPFFVFFNHAFSATNVWLSIPELSINQKSRRFMMERELWETNGAFGSHNHRIQELLRATVISLDFKKILQINCGFSWVARVSCALYVFNLLFDKFIHGCKLFWASISLVRLPLPLTLLESALPLKQSPFSCFYTPSLNKVACTSVGMGFFTAQLAGEEYAF